MPGGTADVMMFFAALSSEPRAAHTSLSFRARGRPTVEQHYSTRSVRFIQNAIESHYSYVYIRVVCIPNRVS